MSVRLPDCLDLIACAPKGIDKLRGLILELAVRGKLVPQDPDDEPASELLKRIAEERKRLEAEGVCKKSKPMELVRDGEKAFVLPPTWGWTRLSRVMEFVNGYAFSSSDFGNIGIGVVKIGDIFDGGLTPETMSRVAQKVVAPLDRSLQVHKGDMVIAMSGATTGKLGVSHFDEVFYLNQRVGKIVPICVSTEFLRTYLTTKISENLRISVGSAIPNLSTEQIRNIVIALPPLAEQRRIVAKVDELMALCDRLEAEQADSGTAHARLVETLLGTLSQSPGADELGANWQLLAGHFDTLFSTEASIDALKQTILQLAVMGKLVSQDPTDEPASELLRRIRSEAQILDAATRVKKQKPQSPVDDAEKTFGTPINWEWIRLQDIINVTSGDGLTSEKMAKSGDIPVFGGNGITGRHDQANVDKPTLVIGRVGFYCGSVHITPRTAWITDNALRVRFSERNLSLEFLFWLLRATNLKGNESATAQPLVTGKGIYPIAVALPPLAEQHRIVAKVDELMALCDRLKADLVDSRSRQARLADTLIAAALEAA